MTTASKIKGAALKYKAKPASRPKAAAKPKAASKPVSARNGSRAVDPAILETERTYAGIMTPAEADAFAASIGRKL
ncbi:MAG: hypothetical protein HC933_16340 [Pleurocapsa sp. SU_196_0]|nr:hypothetical protein [Pleurocapsa sp. SU_196_0]